MAYGANTSLNEMVALLKSLLTEHTTTITNIEVMYGPERTGEVKHSLANVDKARELLGYDPEVDFMDGLSETISWYINSCNYSGTFSVKT